MRNLDERTAIVTGGSRGIGKAIAAELVNAGARVLITGRRRAELEHTRNELGPGVTVHAGDAGDPVDARACVAQAMAQFGRIDVLVNNAALAPQHGWLVDLPIADFESVWRMNVSAVLMWSQLVWTASMRERGGVILNVSSLGGITLQPGMGAYCTSKAGLNHLTRVLAAEMGPGVRVNAIALGLVTTEGSSAAWTDREEPLGARLPLGRLGAPRDAAQVAKFLVSDESAWMTGEVTVVDGGALIQMGKPRAAKLPAT